jgi:hypothetical protein
MTLKEFYEQLLILQYYNQPRARAEIGIEASRWQALKEFLDRFKREFDLDFATGDRLETGNSPQQGRLAAATWPQQTTDLPVFHGQVHIMHHRIATVFDVNILQN